MLIVDWRGVVGFALIVAAFVIAIGLLYVDNHDLRREVDKLERNVDKMREYINARDKVGWNAAAIEKPGLNERNQTREYPTVKTQNTRDFPGDETRKIPRQR